MAKGDREREIEIINQTQDEYENQLISKLLLSNSVLRTINFTSPTGTGKTKMMADIIEKMNTDFFFVITTLSKGQLKFQIVKEISRFTKKDNFIVYGLSDYTKNTILQSDDIENRLPPNKKIIWFRDEGHINTNRWQEILNEKSYKIVNFSATNKFDSEDDIRCNFNHTMMLRSVVQQEGTPEDALEMLIKVKKQHSKVINYNPCAIFRILDDSDLPEINKLCEERNLKCINISEDEYKMIELCDDANEYDVIINKFKITEGVDIRRAHVIYMTNEPKNPATSIQVIGRCRRNALLYRDDIDIFDSKNSRLLENTRVCYAFYSTKGMSIAEDENGDLVSAFCDKISVQELKDNILIKLKNGRLKNGLLVAEAQRDGATYLSGEFYVKKDLKTKFNVLVEADGKKLPVYKTKNEKFISRIPKYVIHNGKIMSKYDINYSNHRMTIKALEEAIPLELVKDYWFENVDNGEIKYSNYGVLNLKYLFKIDKNVINKAIYQMVHEKNNSSFFELEVAIDYTVNKPFIMLRLKNNYSFQFNSINFSKFYFDKDNGFSENLNVNCYFENREMAERKLRSIGEEVKEFIDSTRTVWFFSLPISIEKPEKFEVKKGSIGYVIENKYLGHIYVNDKIRIRYDTTSNIMYVRYNEFSGELLKSFSINLEDSNIKNSFDVSFNVPAKRNQELILGSDDLLPPKRYIYFSYEKIMNDRESTIIGLDSMRIIKDRNYGGYTFIEDRAVTSKISKYSKFKQFLLTKFGDIILKSQKYYYQGKNNFNFNKKCNSALGYLVEYYIKYLLYGEAYYYEKIIEARKESNYETSDIDIIIRACMLKYKELMISAFGSNTSSIIGSKMMSIDTLAKAEMNNFKGKIIELANQSLDIVKENIKVYNGNMQYDPNLSVDHISGLADLIDEDTIMDIKCTSRIGEENILQLLGYYYLSTKRTDLKTRYLITYDVVKNRYIKIDMETREITSNYDVK